MMRGVVLVTLIGCASTAPTAMRAITYRQFWQQQHPIAVSCEAARRGINAASVLAESCDLLGVRWPEGTGLLPWAARELKLYPPRPVRIGSLVCRAKREIGMVDGRLSDCDLAEPATIDAIEVAAATVSLDIDGHLERGRLAADVQTEGLVLRRGTWIERFHPGRRLSTGTLAKRAELGGFKLEPGATVELDSNGQVRAIAFGRVQRLVVGSTVVDARSIKLRPAGTIEVAYPALEPTGAQVELIFDEGGALAARNVIPPSVE